MSRLIAIVDDEPDIIELVSVNLKKAGFSVRDFHNGEDFYQYLKQAVPDLVVLDLMLPDADGLEICRYIRSQDRLKGISIIMLTAKDEEIDKVVGLELGADDYVTKPFSPKELVARVKALFRRTDKTEEENIIRAGGLISLDPARHEVYIRDEKIDLTTTEFNILKILAEKKGRVFSREKLLDLLWGNEKIVLDRTIDVHITHLREKLGEAGRIIKNIRGVGYKIEE